MLRELIKSTTDICDKNPKDVQVLNLQFNDYGKKHSMKGKIVTVSCFEDNSKIIEALSSNGKGKILIIDGKGSLERSLIDDKMVSKILENDWKGIIVAGAIRDIEHMAELDVAIKALGVSPMRSHSKNSGEINVPLKLGGITINPDKYLYGDSNGVLICDHEL